MTKIAAARASAAARKWLGFDWSALDAELAIASHAQHASTTRAAPIATEGWYDEAAIPPKANGRP